MHHSSIFYGVIYSFVVPRLSRNASKSSASASGVAFFGTTAVVSFTEGVTVTVSASSAVGAGGSGSAWGRYTLSESEGTDVGATGRSSKGLVTKSAPKGSASGVEDAAGAGGAT